MKPERKAYGGQAPQHLSLDPALGYPPLFAFTPLETPFLTGFILGLMPEVFCDGG